MKATEVQAKSSNTNLPAHQLTDWGRSAVDPADVLIPKLLIMQPISELVTEGLAKGGEIVRSTTKTAVASPVEFIPLLMFKTWILAEKVAKSNKFEFRKVEPFTHENAQAEWEWVVGTSTWQRSQCLNCYALLPADVAKEAKALAALEKTGAMPDPDDALLPVVLSFQRTSFKTGKALATHFAKAEAFGVPAARTTLTLGTELTKNDKGSYFVATIGKKGPTDELGLMAARKWWTIISKSQASLKVDDSDLASDAAEESAAAGGKSQF